MHFLDACDYHQNSSSVSCTIITVIFISSIYIFMFLPTPFNVACVMHVCVRGGGRGGVWVSTVSRQNRQIPYVYKNKFQWGWQINSELKNIINKNRTIKNKIFITFHDICVIAVLASFHPPILQIHRLDDSRGLYVKQLHTAAIQFGSFCPESTSLILKLSSKQ